MNDITIIGIRENPEYLERGVRYIHDKWGNADNFMLYSDNIAHSIATPSPLPRWYLLLRGDAIVGCCGLITNDFISRSDLWPWLCALYVEESERGHALGAMLLQHARREAARLHFPKVYLCTEHDGYYERYGWRRIEDGYMLWGEQTRIYETDTE